MREEVHFHPTGPQSFKAAPLKAPEGGGHVTPHIHVCTVLTSACSCMMTGERKWERGSEGLILNGPWLYCKGSVTVTSTGILKALEWKELMPLWQSVKSQSMYRLCFYSVHECWHIQAHIYPCAQLITHTECGVGVWWWGQSQGETWIITVFPGMEI